MDKFWEDIVNCLLGVALYHGALPDEKTWVEEYWYETNSMVEDIKHFHESVKSAGMEVSNETMAMFLIYTEFMHIGNDHFIEEAPVDMNTLLILASQINDELN